MFALLAVAALALDDAATTGGAVGLFAVFWWIGYAFIPLGLFMAWDADREARPAAIARRTARPGQ